MFREKRSYPPSIGKKLKSFLLTLALIGVFTLPAYSDPGFLWLEPAASMRRMGGNEAPSGGGSHGGGSGMHGGGNPGKMAAAEKQDVHGSQMPGHPGAHGIPSASTEKEKAGKGVHGKGSSMTASKNEDGKKKEEKRMAMSRPAHYTLKTGKPHGESDSPSFLLKTEATILRPDGTGELLVPAEEKGLVQIRDAALVQGVYYINVSAETIEDGTRYRLFSRDIMRNVGEKPENTYAMGEIEQKFREPYFALLDQVPVNAKNFAKIFRKYTGDDLPLKVHLDGKPVPNLEVTMTTSEGWKQTLKSDEKGEVRFTLVKEKFHDKGAIKTPSLYFVTAEMEVPPQEAGTQREILRSSLSFNVYPTPLDWETKAAGFYTVVIVSAAIGLAAAVRRKRRKRNPCA